MPAYAWTVARERADCGYDLAHVIQAGDLMLEIRFAEVKAIKRRCQSCGQKHLPLTDEAIAQAQAARVDTLERQAIHEESAPVERHKLIRQPRSWASIEESAAHLFDSKAAQGNDR